MLKLDKQIVGTTYRSILAVFLEGVWYSKHASTCLVGCRLPPVDGYVAVCLVLTIEVYD